MRSANKVAVNTLILYLRMIVTIGVSFYTTRVVLLSLGVEDYGIFNLIAGIVAMLSFLNTAMTTSTQRFLSFYQGKNDLNMQKRIFSHSLLLHFVIGIMIVILLELFGVLIFKSFLNIAPDRVEAAKVVYHFISFTVFFTIIDVPFTGSLTANENMLWIAIVNVIETILKLCIAVSLSFVTQDKLIVYGLLTASISIISFLLYSIYCFRRYEECTIKNLLQVDKKLLFELTSFAGWNLFGTICGIARNQGLAVLMNIFLGTLVNAAYAIANQVAGQMNFFSATLLRVVNPQIVKSEGASDRVRMLRISMMASKFGFFLVAFITIPCIYEMPILLKIWLKEVPNNTVIFCSLILLGGLMGQITIGLQSAVQATGRIKIYQIIVGSILLLNLPIAYLLLKHSYPVYSVLVSFVIVEMFGCISRLLVLRNLIGLNLSEYFDKVIFKEVLPVLSSIVVCYLITHFFNMPFRFLVTFSLSIAVFVVVIYFTGLCEDEKQIVRKLIEKGKQFATS